MDYYLTLNPNIDEVVDFKCPLSLFHNVKSLD